MSLQFVSIFLKLGKHLNSPNYFNFFLRLNSPLFIMRLNSPNTKIFLNLGKQKIFNFPIKFFSVLERVFGKHIRKRAQTIDTQYMRS